MFRVFVVLDQITHWAGKTTAVSEISLKGGTRPPSPVLALCWKPVAGAEVPLMLPVLLLAMTVLLDEGDPKVGKELLLFHIFDRNGAV